MSKSNKHAGQINMRGKKYKLLRCRCCECIDFRDKFLKKEHDKEIKAALANVVIAPVWRTGQPGSIPGGGTNILS